MVFYKTETFHQYSLYVQADTAPTEEWLVKLRMPHGLNIFITEGMLLDNLTGEDKIKPSPVTS